jgi:hypothetical protein
LADDFQGYKIDNQRRFFSAGYYWGKKLLIYIKLLIKRRFNNYRTSLFWVAKDLLKYLLYVSTIAGLTIQYRFFERLLSKIQFDNLINSGEILLGALFFALFFAHIGLKIIRFMPTMPFTLFYSQQKFVFMNYFTPLISSSTLLVFFYIFFLFLSFKGLIYAVFFYLFYFFGLKYPLFRIIGLALLLCFYFLSLTETVLIQVLMPIILILIFYDIQKLKNKLGIAAYKDTFHKVKSVILKKEYEYYRYFKSERYYLVLNFLFSLFFLIYLPLNINPEAAYQFSMWIGLAAAILPFSMTLFNLLGMDINSLAIYIRLPKNAILYQLKRIQYYFVIIYFFDLVFAIALYFSFNQISVSMVFLVIAFIFNELIFGISLLYSIYLAEEKEINWRYGQYIKSFNVQSISFVLLFMVLIINISYHYLPAYVLFVLAGMVLFFRYFLLENLAIRGIEHNLRIKYVTKWHL